MIKQLKNENSTEPKPTKKKQEMRINMSSNNNSI